MYEIVITYKEFLKNPGFFKSFIQNPEPLKKWNFWCKERKYNQNFFEEKNLFMQSVNSYLGIMVHYKSSKFSSVQLNYFLNRHWTQFFFLNKDCKKIEKK